MIAQHVLIWISILSPVILTVGMLYGDYKEGEFELPWHKTKPGVNSGAKFG